MSSTMEGDSPSRRWMDLHRRQMLCGSTETLTVIALTLYVCLNTLPDTCRPQNVSFDGSLMTCSMYGQAVAAEWIASHPKYRLKKFTCGLRPLPQA